MNIPDVIIDKIIENVLTQMESDTNKDIFTFAVPEKEGEEIEIILVFTDRSIMQAFITISQDGPLLGVRIRGNFI